MNANIIFAINFAEKYETNNSRCFGEKNGIVLVRVFVKVLNKIFSKLFL